MLTINIHNDGTGTDEAANYRYAVIDNNVRIAHGRVTGHNSADGWRELVRRVAEEK